MAVGTITRVAVDPHSNKAIPMSIGDVKITVTTVVGSASYTTGGDALTPANLGLSRVLWTVCTIIGSASNNAASSASYDIVNKKLQMWQQSGTTPFKLIEVASTNNVSGITATITAFGY